MSTSSKDMQAFQGVTVQELIRRSKEDPALQQRLVVLLAEPQRPRMTYEEFLEWADEDTLVEWVDGEVVMCSPASKRHQMIADFLVKVMGLFVEQRNLGVVVSAPFQMKLEHSGREPDLLFVAQEHLERLKETHLEGPADLVVEVVSPESVKRDRGEKFYEYAVAGIPEYWIIDPQEASAEFYHLAGKRFDLAFAGRDGVYRAQVLPGFWLRVEWLWQEPLPSPIRTLAEIVGMDAQVLDAFERALAGQR